MSFKSQIQRNSGIIAQLRRRIDETVIHRNDNEASRRLWEDACQAFHDQYEELAFPGGTFNIKQRLRNGDKEAIEYALDFIELRPYFYRSGYMFKDFIRVLKNCPLSEGQRKRYDRVKVKYDAYREKRTQGSITKP